MKLNIGNITLTGFVNFVADGRLVIGTGKFAGKEGEQPTYKDSVTVFLHQDFNGSVPKNGDYVEVRADLYVAERKDKAGNLTASMNVRFGNQLQVKEAPKKAAPPADAPAGTGGFGEDEGI